MTAQDRITAALGPDGISDSMLAIFYAVGPGWDLAIFDGGRGAAFVGDAWEPGVADDHPLARVSCPSTWQASKFGIVHDPDTGCWEVVDADGCPMTEGHAEPEGALHDYFVAHGAPTDTVEQIMEWLVESAIEIEAEGRAS